MDNAELLCSSDFYLYPYVTSNRQDIFMTISANTAADYLNVSFDLLKICNITLSEK